MKTIILCGGRGSRLNEETIFRPKPMIEIGGYPVLWHIMKIYNCYGFREFILALGYKGHVIKDYFLNYQKRQNDFSIELGTGNIEYMANETEDWKVHLINTGEETLTGGRLGRLRNILKDEDTFMLTYGDGVSDINVEELVKFHKKHGKLATVTAVRPVARFGNMDFGENARVNEFKEKSQTDSGWINGGFFVLNRKIFDYIENDKTVWEEGPLENLAKDGELMAYQHHGFWKPMDTLRDKEELETMWNNKQGLWRQ